MHRSFVAIILIICCFITACSTRDIQSSLNGSTSQRLVAHSIDDLISNLADSNLDKLKDKKLFIHSYFLEASPLKTYADNRLATELTSRYGAIIVDTQEESDRVMTVFYTSLATDLDSFGIAIPFGFLPGVSEGAVLTVLTLEKFHGISEMYYYVGKTGTENRSKVIQAVVKTDAVGLPFITLPLSNIDRHEEEIF